MKAVIFDMDGVIADTEPLHEKSRDAMLEEFGLDVATVSPRAYAKSKRAFWLETAEEFNLPYTAEELTIKEFDILMEIAERSGLQPTAGLVDVLNALRSKNIKTAVASSSDRVYVEKILKITGLEEQFDFITCGNEVEKAKPEPFVYLKTLDKLGLAAEETIAVEDSDTGAKAAVAAGIRCVGYDAVSDEKFRQKLDLCFKKINKMKDLLQIADK